MTDDKESSDDQAADSETSKDDFVPMEKNDGASLENTGPEKSSVDSMGPESIDPESMDIEGAPESMAPPPASFEVMVSMLFTQAMAALGQMPNPTTGKAELNKPFAKHFIDTMEMLGEKTEGNLSDDETKMLNEALHVLRMSYVGAKE